MRILVISDIHGCLQEFDEILKLVNYQPDVDQLILLGDYVDRGPNSKEVVEKVFELSSYENVIVLMGNHDQRLVNLIENRSPEIRDMFFRYGGSVTLKSYCPHAEHLSFDDCLDFIQKNYAHHIKFLKSLPYYYENDQFIFVHAGLDPKYPNWKDQPLENFLTMREKFLNTETSVDKIVIFGHTMTNKIHGSDNVWFSKDKIGIDGGCALGHQLNCLEIVCGNKFKEYHIKNHSF